MALTACIECDKQISDTAPACPHCGYKAPSVAVAANPEDIPSQQMGFGTLMMLVLGFFIMLIVLMAGLGSEGNNSREGNAPTEAEKQKTLLDQRDKFAERCKNGYISECANELALTNLLNAGGVNTSP